MAVERWKGPADIAWCSEHGLHGARDRCFECNKLVEQITMVPLGELAADDLLEVVGRGWHRGRAEHWNLHGRVHDGTDDRAAAKGALEALQAALLDAPATDLRASSKEVGGDGE